MRLCSSVTECSIFPNKLFDFAHTSATESMLTNILHFTFLHLRSLSKCSHSLVCPDYFSYSHVFSLFYAAECCTLVLACEGEQHSNTSRLRWTKRIQSSVKRRFNFDWHPLSNTCFKICLTLQMRSGHLYKI